MYNPKKELSKFRSTESALLNPFSNVNIYDLIGNKDYKDNEEYIRKLYKQTDLKYTIHTNNKILEKSTPLKSLIKKSGFSGVMIVMLMTLMGGLLANVKYDDVVSYQKQTVYNQKTNGNGLALFTLFGAILGMMVGVGALSIVKTKANKDSVYDIYRRLSLRLFDYLQTIHPELDKNLLKKYNPELAEAVTALLVKNMNSADTEYLRDMAIDLIDKVRNAKIDVNEYKIELKKALEIIKKNLETNKNLYDAVVLLYKGWVPTKFDVNNNDIKNMIYIFAENSNVK